MPSYFLPSNNFVGSSGYGTTGASGISGMGVKLPTTPGITSPTPPVNESPVYRNGQLISPSTGALFSGVNPYDGKTYKNGVPVVAPAGQQFIPGTTTPIDPNDPNQRYRAVSVDKNPAVTGEANTLIDDFKKSAASSLEDFGSYLNDFKSQLSGAVAKGKSATDITGYTNDLAAQQNRYSGALDTALTGAAQSNANTASREQAILAAEQENNRVGTNNALTAAEKLQLGQLGAQISRYKLAGGTPRSLGSDELAMAASGARAIAVPIELQRVQNEQNILHNTALPIANADSARDSQFFQNFSPSVAGSRYQSGTQVLTMVQQAKEKAAAGDFQNAAQLLQLAGAPADMIQRMYSGDVSVIAALNQLLGQSQYLGLQDVLGANVSQPVGASPSFGGLPVSRYNVPNQPITVNGTSTGTSNPYGFDLNAVNRATQYQNSRVVPYSRYAGAGVPNADYANELGI